MIGDPVKDAAMLKEAAPVERAREIEIPILLAFGREDERVPIDHGTRMRAAMRAARATSRSTWSTPARATAG